MSFDYLDAAGASYEVETSCGWALFDGARINRVNQG